MRRAAKGRSRRSDFCACFAEQLERRLLLAAIPAGSEFRANLFTTGNQTVPAVAVDGDGDFVIAWQSDGFDLPGPDIYVRRFNSSGTAIGAEFRVDSFSGVTQSPAIAMDVDGDFVVAWQSDGQDGSGFGIYAKRFNAAGQEQAPPAGVPRSFGNEFRVNTYTTGNQSGAAAAMNADGDFVIAWRSQDQDGSGAGVYAQRYSSAGAPQGTEFRVNTFTAGNQVSPSVAMDSTGNFVVAWESEGQDGSVSGVYAKRYNPQGQSQGGEFLVNTFTTGQQWQPSVAMDADGDFVIAWTSGDAFGVNTQDGSAAGIYAQRYNAAGVPQGTEFRVNTYTTNNQINPTAAMDVNGDFVILWSSNGQDGSSWGIYGKQYNAAGVAQGLEFPVNTYTTGTQNLAKVAMSHTGGFVATWASNGQDGSGDGVYAQRYVELPDTTGPMVGGVFVNGVQARSYSAVSGPMSSIVVSFSKSMSGTGGTTGVNSVTNPANWFVTRDGSNITASISSITFGFNASTNRWQATLNLSTTFTSGNILLMARENLRDLGGNTLDGNRNDSPGGNFLLPFSVTPFGPRGSEFRVNTYTTGVQLGASVATDSVGNFVVAWNSAQDSDGSFGIYAQRYNAAGVPQGAEFRVNIFISNDQVAPRVAMDDSGNFVIAWDSDEQDGDGRGIYARRYNAAGVALSGEFRVNTFTTGNQLRPHVAMDADGDFVIAWSSGGFHGYGPTQDGSEAGVYAQRYNAAGVPQGAEFRVNTYTTGSQGNPSVAMSPTGNFVIIWESFGQGGLPVSIYAQRYNSSGVPQGAEFRVNTHTTGQQHSPSAAMDANGNFVVSWVNTGGDGVAAQRFNAAGVPQGTEFLVNSYTTGIQWWPSVAMDAAGNFVVAWEDRARDGSGDGVYARYYNAAGTPQGSEFSVNTYTTGNQVRPRVSMNADGDAVIAWGSEGQDGSSYGVYAQRYARRVQQMPTAVLLSDSPDPVPSGGLVMLTAIAIGENPLMNVAFFRESNGLPGLQVGAGGDTLLAVTTTPSGINWNANVPTLGLPLGTYTYWAQATDVLGLSGQPASTTNTVTGAIFPPAVSAADFLFETAPQRLSYTFSQNVGASLDLTDIVVQRLPSGPTANPSSVSFDAATNTATFSFASILPDGDYRATLIAAGITNPGGTPMANNHTLDFFFLNGDANRDRVVNLADFNILSSNFGQFNRTFSQGDFTYDGIVNLSDFNILSGQFGKSLGPASFSWRGLSGPTPFADRSPAADDRELDDILA